MTHRQQDLHRTRERALQGAPPATGPRSTVAASWRRVAACGLEPGSTPEIAPLDGSELARRRRGSGLEALIPRLLRTLSCVLDAGHMVVVTDAQGRVLWREGNPRVRRMADDLGFVAGSAWTEGNVGTNAIGTCLVLGEGVHIRGPEHYVDSHTRWGCAAAPVRDPWSGRTLGVVDVSGPSRGVHPAELALVELAARLTAAELVEEHRARLDRLRAHAAPLLARLGGDALAVDRFGHVAAATGARVPDRVVLPDDVGAALEGGRLRLPGTGMALVDPLPGGWLLRLDDVASAAPSGIVLDLVGVPGVRVDGPQPWRRSLSPRHAEILLALVEAGPGGRTAGDLADDLFADRARTVTARAEMSRLRRVLHGVLRSGPYRLAEGVSASVTLPVDADAVLPGSSAPVVLRLRARMRAEGADTRTG